MNSLKIRHIWLFFGCCIVYAFWPASWPSANIQYDKPNQLKIRFQECGCPCPDAFIEQGTLEFNDSIKQRYPTLSEKSVEINLVNFSAIEEKNGHSSTDFGFISNNDFHIKGEVIGADTVACSPYDCALTPIFRVSDWEISTYYPQFWTFPVWLALLLFIVLLIGIPILLILTIMYKNIFNQKKK